MFLSIEGLTSGTHLQEKSAKIISIIKKASAEIKFLKIYSFIFQTGSQMDTQKKIKKHSIKPLRFTNAKSITGVVDELLNLLAMNSSIKKLSDTCFVSLRKAFDIIDRNLILAKLSRIEVTTRFEMCLQNFVDTSFLRIDIFISQSMPQNKGVLPGYPLTHLIFIIIIADLIKVFHCQHCGSKSF